MQNAVESENKKHVPVGRSTRMISSATRMWIAALLLGAGGVLLALFGAASADRMLTSHMLLKAMRVDGSSDRLLLRTGANDNLSSGTPGRSAAHTDGTRHAEAPPTILRIPKIHLEVPVLDGTDALTLNHAAGRVEGTALPGQAGNIGIAAHRDTFFRDLGKLRAGDSIELETSAGAATYVVDGTMIVEPTDLSVLDPRPQSSLTLITCYPFSYIGRAPKRYIVTALLNPPDRGQAATYQHSR